MSTFPTLAAITLPLLSIVAVSGLFLTSQKNGLFDILNAGLRLPASIPPNPDALQHTLAVARLHLDNYFTLMAGFFLPVMNLPTNLSLFVQANHFLGCLMSTWMLMFLESYRKGPFDFAKVGVVFFGLVGEFIGVGFTWPIFFLINGITSYGWLSGGRSKSAADSALFSSRDLAVLPWSVFIGGGVPALLMLVLKPEVSHGYLALQTWVLIRLFHPLFSVIVQPVLKLFTSDSGAEEASKASSKLQGYYHAAYLVSAIPHWMTILAIAVPYFLPSQFSPRTVQALSPSSIWLFASPFQQSPPRITSVAQGVQIFLLWDSLMCASAVLVWALAVNTGTLQGRSGGVVSSIVRTAAITVFAGPGAAAVTLIREKDEVLTKDRIAKR